MINNAGYFFTFLGGFKNFEEGHNFYFQGLVTFLHESRSPLSYAFWIQNTGLNLPGRAGLTSRIVLTVVHHKGVATTHECEALVDRVSSFPFPASLGSVLMI